jgi:IS5 family transposase
MDRQLTFSDVEYGARKRAGRREIVLDRMGAAVPWAKLIAVTEPHYFSGARGRPPGGIETMLRIYFLPPWPDLACGAAEDAVCDSCAMRKFMKTTFLEEDAPEAAALRRFRHLLEERGLRKKTFETVNGLYGRERENDARGTAAGATVIEAPGSTKGGGKSRDPETRSAQKGNGRHFGEK